MRSKAMAFFGILGAILGNVPDLRGSSSNIANSGMAASERRENLLKEYRSDLGKHFIRHRVNLYL